MYGHLTEKQRDPPIKRVPTLLEQSFNTNLTTIIASKNALFTRSRATCLHSNRFDQFHQGQPWGRRGGTPGPIFQGARYFYEKTRYVYVKYYLIGYTHINTNTDSLTKLFLWFRLVINPFGIRFRPLVNPIPNFVKV
ncbi:hypothetical protein Hanom_Chr14g01267531 [Helianthus anomalus]